MRMLVGFAAVLMLTGATFGAGTPARTTPVTPAVTPTAPAAPAEKQVADEIIRRLRRMGFNMIHNRRARPPEYIGELC